MNVVGKERLTYSVSLRQLKYFNYPCLLLNIAIIVVMLAGLKPSHKTHVSIIIITVSM